MTGWKGTVRGALADLELKYDKRRRALKDRLGLTKPAIVFPYRGYGTREVLHLRGRVLEDPNLGEIEDDDTRWTNFKRMMRRYESDEIPGAHLTARFGDTEKRVETDQEGYFQIELPGPAEAVPARERWQRVSLELEHPLHDGDRPAAATGRVLVPPAQADFGIISDIDDTIIHTGATSLFRHAKTVLLNSAASRVPFKGVGAFYRALECGRHDEATNPLFYVSSSPWNLFDLFETFMERHEIPLGPIFLKDFGLTRDKFFKGGHASHKLDWIKTLLDLYPDLNWILIGDSGQKDASIYREAARRFPGRVQAVYLRDVSRAENDLDFHRILDEIRETGAQVTLAEDTAGAAENAAAQGWIKADALPEIRGETRE